MSEKLNYILGIKTDGTQTAKEFDKVAESVRKVDSAAGGAASAFEGFGRRILAILGPLAVFREITGTIDRFGRIADDAKRAGVSAEKFQAWSFALGEAGIDPSAIFAANRTLARQQTDVLEATRAGKTTDAGQAFARLGITPDVLGAVNREQLLEIVATQAAKGPTEGPAASQLVNDLQMLIGRDADSLLAAFRDGFVESVRSAVDRGLVLPEADVAALDTAGDMIARAALRARVLEAQALVGVGRGAAANTFAGLDSLPVYAETGSSAQRLEQAVRNGTRDIVTALNEKL